MYVCGLTEKTNCVYTAPAFCQTLDKMRKAWSIAKIFLPSHVYFQKETEFNKQQGCS